MTLVLVLVAIRAAGVLQGALEEAPQPEAAVDSLEHPDPMQPVAAASPQASSIRTDGQDSPAQISTKLEEVVEPEEEDGAIFQDFGRHPVEGLDEESFEEDRPAAAARPAAAEVTPPPRQRRTKSTSPGHIQRLRAIERGGNLDIEVIAGIALKDFRSFAVEDPRRLVVDLPGTWSASVPKDLTMRHHLARGVRIGRHGDRLRLVVDLMPDAQSVPRVHSTENGLIIEIRPVSLQPLPL